MSIFESDYTPQEIELIKEFYPIRTARDIGFFLGRTAGAIECKARRLGVLKRKRFTKEEDRFIANNCHRHTAIFVAYSLGRSVGTVMERAARLNCRFQKCGDDHPNTILTSQDIELIRDLHDEGMHYSEIAEKFECSQSHIKDIVAFRKRLYADSVERNITLDS
ncbi:hypothetical protein ACPUEJ_24540 (plasmid) [Vibrio tubiashii]|uniref:hypothetical protein n=1 Tax=Vibrio tubiashii TaxID=29498 RepID=UPI003CE5B59E